MGEIIFAVPRHDYASYRDLYALIDLSGFPTCTIDEIDPQSDNAYIITILSGEVPEGGYPNARAKIALWDLEWHMDGVPPLANVEYWAADKWYAEQIGAKYVPMGSHPDLRPNADSTWHERYDVAYIGYFAGVPRRQPIRQQLIERGVKVSPPQAWGEERHKLLSNSTAYLHVHQLENAPTIAPLRMVVAAAYALPFISETVADAGIFKPVLLFAPYDAIPRAVQEEITLGMKYFGEKPFNTLEHGMDLHQLLCHDFTFRKSVESVL